VANGKVFVTSYNDVGFTGKLNVFTAAGCGGQVCAPVWTAPLPGGVIDAGPAVAGGFVYLSSFIDGKLNVFDSAGCGQATCQPVWTAPGENYADATPAVARGVVYMTGGDGTLFAYAAKGCGQPTCQALWTGFAGGTQAAYVSPPVVAGGVVYTTKNNAHVFAWKASGCRRPPCRPLWSAQTDGQIVSAGPVIVNGRLYVGSEQAGAPTDQGRLYVYTINGA
jgi:outer membrane protein assembly factor BamB